MTIELRTNNPVSGYSSAFGDSKAVILDEEGENKNMKSYGQITSQGLSLYLISLAESYIFTSSIVPHAADWHCGH